MTELLSGPEPDASARPDDGPLTPPVETLLRIVVVVAVVAGTVARFWPRSDLWLDEALSVNIAHLPLGDIGEALRHDGHPPLYYLLLHVWMAIGGTGDWWVRSLSGFISLLGYPLVYLAGVRVAARTGTVGLGRRRLGLIAVAVFAVLPFGVRYATETRMYSLLMVLVLAAYLLVDDLLSGRTPRGGIFLEGAGVAVLTGAMLWTHYWSMWLAGGLGLFALWRVVRERDELARRRGALTVVGALVAGGVLFLPWVPSLLYQSANTGTPWGKTFRPATMLVVTVVDFAGGSFSESQLGSYVLVVLIALAAFAAVSTGVATLRGRVDGRVRNELVVVGLTLALAWAASAATHNTFASRYTAVIFPLFVLCVAAGIAVVRTPRATAVVLAVVVAAGLVSSSVEVFRDRTQAGATTDAIAQDMAAHPDSRAVVVTCPDQLAPAVQRGLAGRMDDPPPVIPYPGAGDPRFVDWVNYATRNKAADPAGFLAKVGGRIAANTTVYVAANTSYLTYEGKCEALLGALGTNRSGQQLTTGNADNFYEAMGLWVFRPRP